MPNENIAPPVPRPHRATRRRWPWIVGGVLLVLLLAVGGFVLWAAQAAAPMPEALAALQSDARVTVQDRPWWIFQPAGAAPTTGLIFYPGAKVDPRAYAPAAHQLAAAGNLVVIVPMPLNLAVFGAGRAGDVIAAYPQIQHWAVGGHSLGGSMAANFAAHHPGAVAGLVLWASYPAGADTLAATNLAVVSISGSQDGLATPADIDAARPLLPPATTQWVIIAGGNHAQFGWYGAQGGDAAATISRSDQQAQVVTATLQLLTSLK